MIGPCDHCPWKIANQGKHTPWGFYTKHNLTRLWHQIRTATDGTAQGCHPTDPSHPDHVAAGAKPGSTARECAGSVILVLRELRDIERCGQGEINPEGLDVYFRQRRRGLTRTGVLHWLLGRYKFGGTPFGSGQKLPDVDESDPEVDLPPYLKEAR